MESTRCTIVYYYRNIATPYTRKYGVITYYCFGGDDFLPN